MKPYKIFIMQYARRETSTSESFLGDPHQTPLEMAYYMWAVTNGEHSFVVDMGFTRPIGERRGREWVCDPEVRLKAVGFDPAKVERVVITHMHYDHVGNHALFPNARFFIQEDELAFWTGRYAKYRALNHSIEVEDVVTLVRANFEGRVAFTRDRDEIVPGVRVHRASGHTKGMQIVEVPISSGTAVVASDATHYYRHFQEYTPFPVLHDIPGVMDGYEKMRELASREELILPGHDPEVLKRHPLQEEGIALLA